MTGPLLYLAGLMTGSILGCILTAMLLYREPIKLEQEEEPVGDFPYSSHVMKDGL